MGTLKKVMEIKIWGSILLSKDTLKKYEELYRTKSEMLLDQ